MKSAASIFQFTFILLGAAVLLGLNAYFSEPPNRKLHSSQPSVNPLVFTVGTSKKNLFPAKDLSRYVTVHQSEKVANGLTIIPLSGPDTIIAIDTQGQLINSWNLDAERARFLSNGNILVGFGSKFRDDKAPWKSMLDSLGEYDWNARPVWGYTANDSIHHDHQRLANGNTLFLKKTPLPDALLQKVKQPHRKKLGQIADSLVEVSPDGRVVWQLDLWETFDVNYCGKDSCAKTVRSFTKLIDDPNASSKDLERATTKITDWAHVNTVNVLPENKWFDAGDTRFRPGNILLMPRKFKTVYIIDRDTKKVVWEYAGSYKGGLGGAHEPYMIEKGNPGAGNILIFDNGGLGAHPGETYVLEVQPDTKEVVWAYDKGKEFNIRTRGGAQRLWNGNTLISEDPTGRIFEVDAKGEIVWEFLTPYPINRAKRYRSDYYRIP